MIRLKVHPLMMLSAFRLFPFLLLMPTLYLKIAFLVFVLCYGIFLIVKKRVLLYKTVITVESGMIIKRKCTVKKENISGFCFEKGPLSHLFGAVTLKLYTKAEKRGAAAVSVRIYKQDINTVYEYFGVCGCGESIKTGFLKTLWASAATSSAVLGFLVAMPFFSRAEKLFGVGVSAYLFQKIGEISENIALPTVSGTVGLLLFVFYFVSLIVNLCRNLFAKIKDHDTAFSYIRGFPVSKHTTLFKGAVSSLLLNRPFVLRIFGRGQIAVPTSAFSKVESPVLNIKTSCAETLLPCLKSEGRIYARKNTLYRFLRWRILCLFLVVLLYRIFVLLFPLFSQFIGLLCSFVSLALFYLVLLGFYAYKTAWIAENDIQIVINAVSGFSVKRAVFSKNYISEIKIIRYPTDIKQGTCTIKITAHPTGESAKIKCIADNFFKTGKDSKKGELKC